MFIHSANINNNLLFILKANRLKTFRYTRFANLFWMCDAGDRIHIFLVEAVHKRPQDSARRHAVVHPISPSVGRDGGLPSGGHLFPSAGHLLELHQSNVSHFYSFCLLCAAFSLLYNYLLSHRTRLARRLGRPDDLETPHV